MSAITCGRTGGCPFASSFPWAAAGTASTPAWTARWAALSRPTANGSCAGDDDWLRSLWPQVKLALEYAWSPANPYRWDGNKDGVLEGRQHHTLDMELYGPNAWLQGFYLAALRAGEEMAAYLGEAETAAAYRALFEKGKAWTKEHLFNGAYFDQPIA